MPYKQKKKSQSKRRNSYAPIMLTSKSIKPVQRQQNESMSLTTKFRTRLYKNNLANTAEIQELSQQIYKGNHSFKPTEIDLDQDYTSNSHRFIQNLSRALQTNNRQRLTSTSVIKMQFNKDEQTMRKNHGRYKESASTIKNEEQNISTQNDTTVKLVSHSNAKTHESFYKHNKIKPYQLTFSNFKQRIYEKKMVKLERSKNQQDEWNKYLNKYYLNIKKVDPLIKRQQSDRQASSTQNSYVLQSFNIQQKTPITTQNRMQPFSCHFAPQKIDRTRSSTVMHGSKKNSDCDRIQLSACHKKIQIDMMTKRVVFNRKDYFVFSMGDLQNKNNQNPNKIKFDNYKDFIWKVNFSNGMYVRLPDQIQKPYKFYVGFGNNSAIIKGVMRRRFWWQLVDKPSLDTNFVWTQLRSNDFLKSQKKHKVQSTNGYNISIQHHNQHQPKDLDQGLIQSVNLHNKIFKGRDIQLWKAHYKINQKIQQKAADNFCQKRFKTLIKKKKMKFIQDSSQLKVHNHFQCNYFLGNKKALFYAMRRFYTLKKRNPFQFIPLTFHISEGLQDPQYKDFLEQHNRISDKRLKDKQIKNIWIVKPGQVTNRGRGITVCATLDEIKIRLRSKQKNSDGSLRTYILQKYIEKPLLYQKRKFDIRHYMLMDCVNGQMKGYWYTDGYIRTTSTQYNIKNCKDLYTHLTNDAIQQNSSDYGKFEKGNKLSYQQFNKYLKKTQNKRIDFFNDILPQMKQIATHSMKATYSMIEPHRRQHNFELFGLDFMLDEDFKVYLIEVNTNPCLQTCCPILSKIISQLIENIFKICVDPLFPPPNQWPNSKKFLMGENALNDSKFQLVFDEVNDHKELQALNAKNTVLSHKLGKVQEQNDEYDDKNGEQQAWMQEGDLK